MPVPPEPAADELTLYVPRTISAVVLGMAALWSGPLVVAVASGRPVSLGFQLLNGVIALALLAFGVDTVLIRVRMSPQSVTVRRWLGRTTLTWPEVKGVALLQDGGTPQLRLVTHGDPVIVPAWSLRARHPDGAVERAAEALPRFGQEHGIKVRVRTLAGRPHRP